MSFWAWLSQINPNVAASILVSLVVAGYHFFFSAGAQAKVAAALESAISLADRALQAAIALAPAGTTKDQLEADLLNIAKAQLAHAGLDPDKLPAPALALVKAIVAEALGKWRAAQPTPQLPAPQTVPVIAIPPAPPTPSGTSKGSARLGVMIAVTAVVGATLGCATAQKMTGAFATCEKANLGAVIENIPAELAADLTLAGVAPKASVYEWIAALIKANVPALEADLATIAIQVGMDTVECAYVAVAAVLNAGSNNVVIAGSGSETKLPPPTSLTTATPSKPSGLVRAKAWLKTQGRDVP